MTFAAATTATQAVAVALFSALDGNLSAPVFDFVPDGQDFPYVTIGESIENRFDVHGRGGKTLLVPIHVWSRFDGSEEVRGLVEEIDTILDRTPSAISVSGWTVVRCENESTRVLRQPDAVGAQTGTATRHGIAQYRIVVQKD